MRILITGGRGILGQSLNSLLQTQHKVYALSKEELDIQKKSDIDRCFSEIKPHIVLNCAAYTKVDKCETNRELAFSINAYGAYHVASACKERNVTLIHFSTDYIFDGTLLRPYKEEDLPRPQSIYGASKFKGEELVRETLSNTLLIRSQWLYGAGGHNFVLTILRLAHDLLYKGQGFPTLKIVEDQWGSPTYTEDLARGVKALIERNASGIYHMTNSGQCTWKEFAEQILSFSHLKDVAVTGISSEESDRLAKRPKFSVLDNGKVFSNFHFTLPPWQDALQRFLSTETSQ